MDPKMMTVRMDRLESGPKAPMTAATACSRPGQDRRTWVTSIWVSDATSPEQIKGQALPLHDILDRRTEHPQEQHVAMMRSQPA
jgi:hypothetical protein